jgi:tetratricopeptide (TPR) repeat protein
MVERAAEAAASLRSAGDCVREAEVSPTNDEVDRDVEADLLARLAGTVASWEAQRFDEVDQNARTIAEDAQRAGVRGVEAEALALVANAAARQGRVAEAVVGLELAARIADAAGIDDRRVDALVDLVYVAGHLAGDPRAGHWYARLARAVFDRLGDRPSRKANLLLNEGVVYGDEARLEESLAAYAEALAVWRTDGGVPDETLAVLLNNIGSTHLLRDDPGAAVAWFMQAHVVRLWLSGPEHPAVADVLVNLGNVFQKLGEGEAALVSFRQALGLLERTRGADSPATRVVLNNLGVVLLDLGRFDEARMYARRTVELYHALEVETTAEGAVVANLAELDLLLGDATAALAGYRRAYELVTQTMPPSHPYAINAVSGLARASFDLGDDRSAIAWSRWALGLEDPVETPLEIRAEPRMTLARSLARTGADRTLILGLARAALVAYDGLGGQAAAKAAELRALLAAPGGDAPRPDALPRSRPAVPPDRR